MPNPYQSRPHTHVPSLRQHGFSLLAMFFFAIVSLGLASYFLTGKSYNASNVDSADRGRASMVISQGAAIQAGFNLLLGKGTAPDQVRLDATADVGIYNADAGGTVQQLIDPSAVAANGAFNGVWIYRGLGIQNAGVGSGGASYALVVSGLSTGTCMAINSILHNFNAIPAGAGKPSGAFRSTSASLNSPNDFFAPVSLSGNVALKGWDKGCVGTSDGVQVYFQVILPQ